MNAVHFWPEERCQPVIQSRAKWQKLSRLRKKFGIQKKEGKEKAI
jgi:hypothetical protein